MSQHQLSTVVLPPGFETRDNTVYGYLYIEIGKLLWLRGAQKADKTKVKIKFWGDQSSGQFLRPTNAASELKNIPTALQYEIRCPLIGFYRYLDDCVRLRFFVIDARNDKPLGAVTINLQFYLKHRYSLVDYLF